MQKKFNDTGLCVPNRHYMVDISDKINQIVRLVEYGEYFTINRPRQFGKTTTLAYLERNLNQRDNYLVLKISFEGVGDSPFNSEKDFCPELLKIISDSLIYTDPETADFFSQESEKVHNFKDLSMFISRYVLGTEKNVVLLIDEVDKSSDNQIFLNFIGMLRNKYLNRDEGKDYTFQSVILAGVHDVKTLKLKIRPDDEQKYNSPWNIAVDFNIDMSFNPDEIATMLTDYSKDKQIEPDISKISDKLYYYTSGYPYLVSKLCKFIDELIIPQREEKNWTVNDVDEAFKMIVNEGYTTTLFDSLTKNLENDRNLYDLVFDLVINGRTLTFTITNPLIYKASMYGIISGTEGICKIHNRIFEQKIYAHMMSHVHIKNRTDFFASHEFYTDDNGLDIKLILQKFQSLMKEHYSNKDQKFLEREGRLLFLSFLRPIINGKGFDFKEPNVADERRMDIVITYMNNRYVLELKRWYGPKAHQKGLQQLSNYLDMYSLNQGWLLIYDFSKNKEYKQEDIVFKDKNIFAVWV